MGKRKRHHKKNQRGKQRHQDKYKPSNANRSDLKPVENHSHSKKKGQKSSSSSYTPITSEQIKDILGTETRFWTMAKDGISNQD